MWRRGEYHLLIVNEKVSGNAGCCILVGESENNDWKVA